MEYLFSNLLGHKAPEDYAVLITHHPISTYPTACMLSTMFDIKVKVVNIQTRLVNPHIVIQENQRPLLDQLYDQNNELNRRVECVSVDWGDRSSVDTNEHAAGLVDESAWLAEFLKFSTAKIVFYMDFGGNTLLTEQMLKEQLESSKDSDAKIQYPLNIEETVRIDIFKIHKLLQTKHQYIIIASAGMLLKYSAFINRLEALKKSNNLVFETNLNLFVRQKNKLHFTETISNDINDLTESSLITPRARDIMYYMMSGMTGNYMTEPQMKINPKSAYIYITSVDHWCN